MIKAELTNEGHFHWRMEDASPAELMGFALFVLGAVAEPEAKEKFNSIFSQTAEIHLKLREALAPCASIFNSEEVN